MAVEHAFVAAEPEVITSRDGKTIILRFEKIDGTPGQFSRSGQHIHLSLGPATAMRLMKSLEATQKRFGWPLFEGPVETIDVPSQGEKH